jgi:putative endonuclease
VGSNPTSSATLRHPKGGFGWQATPVWYVYFLELDNGDVYVGSTNDLRRRVKSHQDGRVGSTRSHLPVALRSYIVVETEIQARALERYFKSGSGKAFAKKRFFRNEPRAPGHRNVG